MDENFAHFLERNARRLGEKAALVWENGCLSWTELDRQASGFAGHLAAQGIGPGDRVAIVLPNRWTFVVALLGVLKVGATAAPLSPDLKRAELAEFLADLRPKQVVDEVKAEEGVWLTPAYAPSPAVIVYTSGSTGRPKGAVFSHKALTFANRMWGEVVMGLKSDDVVLGVLPYSHNYGLYAGLLAPLLFGATAALVERFAPEAVLAVIKRHRVTIFPGVATMFRRLLSSPLFSTADLSSLRLAVSGAAPCSSELCTEWRENTDIRILCGYGMTEVPRPISYFADDPDELPGAAGRLLPGVEVRLVDEEGQPVPEGEVGELFIRSPAAMDAYLDDPDETRAVLREGWFNTGDLAALLPEGFVRLVGRKRERILRGGYSVFPQEIEAVLCSHPAIAEAAVAGIPDPDLGEEVAAFVALKPLAEATSEELVAYCKERLAYYKYPRRLIIVKELPRGATGKVLKSELVKAQLMFNAGESFTATGRI
jgi:long-chain acyl-CoA synthetase